MSPKFSYSISYAVEKQPSNSGSHVKVSVNMLLICVIPKCEFVLVQIWQKVKAANPNLSVCEVGATIGRMWRELTDIDKQGYNVDFANDKVIWLLIFCFKDLTFSD